MRQSSSLDRERLARWSEYCEDLDDSGIHLFDAGFATIGFFARLVRPNNAAVAAILAHLLQIAPIRIHHVNAIAGDDGIHVMAIWRGRGDRRLELLARQLR